MALFFGSAGATSEPDGKYMCLQRSDHLQPCSSEVCPPIGGFSSQRSSLNVAGQRPCPWNKQWCLGRTHEHNKSDHKEPKRRCVAKFQWPEPLATVTEPDVPDVAGVLHWRTMRPPRGPGTGSKQPDASSTRGDGWTRTAPGSAGHGRADRSGGPTARTRADTATAAGGSQSRSICSRCRRTTTGGRSRWRRRRRRA